MADDFQVFTVEIEGRPIAVFGAEDQEAAAAWFDSEPFKEDLSVLETDGQPLWDGVAELRLRKATAKERQRWDTSYREALSTGKAAGDPGDWLIFLVPVTDPTDPPDLHVVK